MKIPELLAKLTAVNWAFRTEELDAWARAVGVTLTAAPELTGPAGESVQRAEIEGLDLRVLILWDEVVEVTLIVARIECDEGSGARYAFERRQWEGQYRRMLMDASTVLGPPDFEDSRYVPGFPDDQDAERIALWRRPTMRVMVLEEHAQGGPFSVQLKLTPPRVNVG